MMHRAAPFLLSLVTLVLAGGAVYCYAHDNVDAGGALLAAVVASLLPSPIAARVARESERDTDPGR